MTRDIRRGRWAAWDEDAYEDARGNSADDVDPAEEDE